MFSLLVRIVLFVVGIAMMLDTTLPTRNEEVKVDLHRNSTTKERTINADGTKTVDINSHYQLYFIGGKVDYCNVGYDAYTRLKDGDKISVRSTKIFEKCIQISKDEEPIKDERYWRMMTCIIGLLCIAAAFGLIDFDSDNGFSIGTRSSTN